MSINKKTDKNNTKNKICKSIMLQISFEMMLITSAIIGFALTGLGIYHNFENMQTVAYSGFIANEINTSNTSIVNFTPKNPEIYTSLQNITYINKSNSLQILFSVPVNSNVSIKINPSSRFIAYPNSSSLQINGIYAARFSIVPNQAGVYDINITARLKNSLSNISKNISLDSYAVKQPIILNNSATNLPIFTITRKNESLFYGIGKEQEIYSAIIISNCASQAGYSWSTQNHINMCNGEPGAVNIGYFWEPYSCNYEQPVIVCIYLSQTNNFYSKINNTYSIFYNIVLNISGLFPKNIYSNLSSAQNNENISYNSKKIGNINVKNVSGTGNEPYLIYIIRNNSNKNLDAVNMSMFNLYYAALENLKQDTSYYNGASLNNIPNELSLAVEALNNNAQNFINAPSQETKTCSIITKLMIFECNSSSVLFYNILFNTSSLDNTSIKNISLQYQGSIMHLFN